MRVRWAEEGKHRPGDEEDDDGHHRDDPAIREAEEAGARASKEESAAHRAECEAQLARLHDRKDALHRELTALRGQLLLSEVRAAGGVRSRR
jgi:hypothetical protein